MNDFDVACSQAKLNRKPLLLLFTGSDWCVWCRKLESEIFAQPAFRDWLSGRAVLYQADFPRQTSLSAEKSQANEVLARRYGIEGFPTVVIADADGHEIARTGYRQGGSTAYIAHLEALLPKRA